MRHRALVRIVFDAYNAREVRPIRTATRSFWRGRGDWTASSASPRDRSRCRVPTRMCTSICGCFARRSKGSPIASERPSSRKRPSRPRSRNRHRSPRRDRSLPPISIGPDLRGFYVSGDNLAEGLSSDGPIDAEQSLLTEEVKIGCTLGMLQWYGRRSCGGQQPVAEIVPNTQPSASAARLILARRGFGEMSRRSSRSERRRTSARVPVSFGVQ
jgi:hypothetical protein